MKKRKSILLLLVVFLNIMILNSSMFVGMAVNGLLQSKSKDAPKSWTIMLYFCADTKYNGISGDNNGAGNWLYYAMWDAMVELQNLMAPGSDSELNVLCLFDSPYSSSYPTGNAQIFRIFPGYNIMEPPLGPKNLGSGTVLRDFIYFCKNNYPADHYALALTDHGGGYAGFCYDFHGQHPYWNYTFGDCLTAEEIETALQVTGGVDVLIFDTCLGGSFEIAWQLVDEVDYIVGGEAIQVANTLKHSKDFVYFLSYDTTMTPLEFAQVCFDTAGFPVQVSGDNWKSCSLYDVNSFDIGTGATNFKNFFGDFTDKLIDELNHDFAAANETFRAIRNNLTYYSSVFATNSMMIDLLGFVDLVIENADLFHYSTELYNLATQVKNWIDVSPSGILLDEWHRTGSAYEGLHGFSICFPDSRDLYQGYLYPNFYENLDLSVDTQWEEFIFRLYPEEDSPYLDIHIPEFWEVNLYPIDPCVNLHVFIMQEGVKDPPHVGLNDAFQNFGMGIELGIEGAEFYRDLQWGSAMIRLPSSSLQFAGTKADEDVTFQVVVNATGAPVVTQQVNLTVKHVSANNIVWMDNKITDIEAGQVLSCDVSTNDTMTDLTPEEPATTTPPTTTPPTTPPTTNTTTQSFTGFIGPAHALIASAISLSAILIVASIFRKKKKRAR
ncbi:MAG: clostripain-related cysteine peptidase [Promethearchaeota archaeon]